MLGGKILSNKKGHFDPTGRTSQSGPPLKGGPSCEVVWTNLYKTVVK